MACLGSACLVDAAKGSKLTPRRAEHVTQVCGCVLLAAFSELPNSRHCYQLTGRLLRNGICRASDGDRAVDWIHNHGRCHNARTIELYLYQYDSDRRGKDQVLEQKPSLGYSSMNSGWLDNVDVSMCLLGPHEPGPTAED